MDLIGIPISKQPEVFPVLYRSIGDHCDPPEPGQFVDVSDVFKRCCSPTVQLSGTSGTERGNISNPLELTSRSKARSKAHPKQVAISKVLLEGTTREALAFSRAPSGAFGSRRRFQYRLTR